MLIAELTSRSTLLLHCPLSHDPNSYVNWKVVSFYFRQTSPGCVQTDQFGAFCHKCWYKSWEKHGAAHSCCFSPGITRVSCKWGRLVRKQPLKPIICLIQNLTWITTHFRKVSNSALDYPVLRGPEMAGGGLGLLQALQLAIKAIPWGTRFKFSSRLLSWHCSNTMDAGNWLMSKDLDKTEDGDNSLCMFLDPQTDEHSGN